VNNLVGRHIIVFLRHPAIEKNDKVEFINQVEGLCVMDGRSEIKIYDRERQELITIQKRNIALIRSSLSDEEMTELDVFL
jgi:hypothetical protein